MRTKNLIIKWSLITSFASAVVLWAMYYFLGHFPVIASIQLSPNWIINLPFGIHCWWYIFITPLWSTTVIFTFSQKSNPITATGMIIGLFFGAVCLPATGLHVWWSYGLIDWLLISPIIGLAASWYFGVIMAAALGLVQNVPKPHVATGQNKGE